jgi:hypothetical protein
VLTEVKITGMGKGKVKAKDGRERHTPLNTRLVPGVRSFPVDGSRGVKTCWHVECMSGEWMMNEEPPSRHEQFLRQYSAHEPAVRAFVRRLVPSRDDVPDVMQEVALVL